MHKIANTSTACALKNYLCVTEYAVSLSNVKIKRIPAIFSLWSEQVDAILYGCISIQGCDRRFKIPNFVPAIL